jgi:transcription antitermination factor NusA-like protein
MCVAQTSQDSFEQIIPTFSKPTALRIRWPSGKTVQIEIKEKEGELVIGREGMNSADS